MEPQAGYNVISGEASRVKYVKSFGREAPAMITFFTTPKPFTGHNGVIQRNALKSWTLAAPGAEVILFGDEEGASETARDLGIKHVREVERVTVFKSGFASTTSPSKGLQSKPLNLETRGPKILRSFFDAAQEMAKHDAVCYANCDIVLMDDFAAAVAKVQATEKEFLVVGRRWDVDVMTPIDFEEPDWKEQLRKGARTEGQQRSGDWIDYFAFRKGFYLGKMPELVIGRVFWDQWLVWKAQSIGAVVVDASDAVMAIHQNHDYGYHPAGKTGVWTDALSQRNYRLAGGRWHLRTIEDATHVLGPQRLKANPMRTKRTAERVFKTAKDAAWMAAMDWTRPLRKAVGSRKSPSSQAESETPAEKSPR
jgi:hypothetical protein